MPVIDAVLRRILPGSWYSQYAFVRNDPSGKDDIPITKKIGMWRKGFYANRYYYYGFGERSSDGYLSDYFNKLTRPKNGPYSSLIDNKLYLPIYLGDYPQNIPAYLFLLTRDKTVELAGDRRVWSKDDPSVLDRLLDLLRKQKCVCKPVTDTGGQGILVLESRSGQFLVNNEVCTEEELRLVLRAGNNCLVSEFVPQHSYAARLNATTTNTVRLLTCWDDETNEPFVARAFHRIGRPGMYGADNGALGGLLTDVDISTGTLGQTALPNARRVDYVERHPDTAVQICGTKIPRFDAMVDQVLQMCRTLNFIPYIAWDIVVTEDAFKVLELNSNTDLYGYQLFGPLLSDARLVRFYERFITKKTQKFFMK